MVLLIALACGSKSQQSSTPPPGEAGSASPDCAQERCLPDISPLVQERRPATRACYDNAKKRQPALGAGRVIINFKIDPDGSVIETSQGMQDEQLTDQQLVDCVSDVIKQIKFAKSTSGKTTRAYHLFEFR